MFEPDEESIVLEMIGNFFDISVQDMMKIGDKVKGLLFDPGVESEDLAIEQIKASLADMPKEHVLIAGVFMSGLLRCNLIQELKRQHMQEAKNGTLESDPAPKSE